MIGFGYTDATNTNSPAYMGFEETSNSGDTKGVLTFHTRDVITDTAPTERMRINSTGVVSIGNTENTGYSDDYLVQVGTDGSGSNSFGMLIRANTSGTGKLGFADGADADATGKVWYDHSTNYMRFDTAGSERMRIESSAMVKLAPSINIGSIRNQGVSVNTSATNVLDMGSLVTSGDLGKGRYLVTVCANGGTVGTAATGIFGLSNSGAVYLYETVNADSITLGVNGANITAATSSGTYTMHANAIPLSVDN
jgi:hypothetical protein